MKNKKSLLVIVVLLLVVVTGGVVTLTYSRYLSSATGTSTANVAPWKVSINETDIVASNTFTANDINWSTSTNTADGYIAPGTSGTFDIEIDPTGSKVALQYQIDIDTSAITNSNITISSVKVGNVALTETSGIYTGSFTLAEVEAGTSKTVTVTITWADANTTEANTNDTTTGSTVSSISLPVTVTASQLVG